MLPPNDIPRSESGASAAPTSETVVLDTIADCRRRLTWRSAASRLAVIVGLAVLSPLLVVVGDHLCAGGLPRLVLRVVLVFWAVGVTIALLAVLLVALLQRISPLFVARYIEQAGGIRHNPLVNALLLRRTQQMSYVQEPAARQAALAIASGATSEATLPRRGRWPLVVLLVVGFAWVAYWAGSPKPIVPSLTRFFGADHAAPTATWLELIHPGADDTTHVGEPLVVEFAVHGQPVTDVELKILPPDGEDPASLRAYTSEGPLDGDVDHRRFVLAPFEVRGDIHYLCRAGDARLEGVLPVQPQPEVLDLEIELVPPAYTGWRARMVRGGDLEVLAGTRASLVLRANAGICDPVFVLSGELETRTRMTVATERPREARLTMTLVRGGRYHLEFSDPWGYALREPSEHALVVRADAAPDVKIVDPAVSREATIVVDVTKVAALVAVAEDDVGVHELTFVLEQNGVANRSAMEDAGPLPAARVVAHVPLVDLPIPVGGSAQAWIEAVDGRVLIDGEPSPQTARSRTITLVRSEEAAEAPEDAAGDESDESSPTEPEGEDPQRESADGSAERDEAGSEGDEEGVGGDARPEPGQEGEAQPESRPARQPRADDGASDDADRVPEPEPGASGDAATGDDTTDEQGGDDLEGAIERFVREHRDAVRELTRGQREAGGPDADGNDGPTDGDCECPDGQEDATAGRGENDGSEAGDGEETAPQPAETAAGDEPGETTSEGEAAEPTSEQSAGETPPSGEREEESAQPASQPSDPESSDDGQSPPSGGEPAEPDDQVSGEPSEADEEVTPGETAPRDGENAGGDPRTAPPEDEAEGEAGPTPEEGAQQPPDRSTPPDDTSEAGESSAEGKSDDMGGDEAEAGEEASASESAAGQGQSAEGREEGQPPGPGAPDEDARSDAADEASPSGGSSRGGGEDSGGEVSVSDEGREASGDIPSSQSEPGDEAPLDGAGLEETLDLLEMLERGEEIDAGMLVDAGWPARRAQAFVAALRRLESAARRAGGVAALRQMLDTRVGDPTRQAGRGWTARARRDEDPVESRRDGLERISPPAEQDVPEHLRGLLDAYYRSLARQRERQTP